MQFVRSVAHGAFEYISRGNAERLWIHYAVALMVIFGLLVATQMVNRAIIERGTAVAEVNGTSSNQILLGHDVLILAEATLFEDSDYSAALADAITAFENAHQQVKQTDIWSKELQQHYFASPAPLDIAVADFVDLARQLDGVSLAEQQQFLTQLKASFTREKLKGALLEATHLIAVAGQAELDRLSNWQRMLIRLSVVLLIIEVLVIFLPAQLIVRSNIRQLKAQGDTLRRSEARLQEANGQLEHLINHDALTGLPNRGSLITYLRTVLADKDAAEMAVLSIGLDGFKSINDTAGHEFGDDVLTCVACTLKSCVDEDHIVARIGGDEFVVISDEAASAVIKRIRSSFSDPIQIRGRRLPIAMSIGFLEISDGRQDPIGVMRDVGLAMQVAKNQGGNRTQRYESQLREDIGSMHQLQLDLTDAIKNGEIEPWFQPQIRMSDGRLHGVEVLARWRHPTRGLLTPDKFLSAAELSGQMVDVDHCIWRSAMDYARQWQESAIWRPCISLNAAPDTISDPHLIGRILLQMQQ
ncbi:MAG: diguanylate cyclase, partial [Pseudomonadota bacterium]